MDIEEQGVRGEEAFEKWLNEARIPYLHIGQDTKTFSSLFGQDLKRPDYLILFQSIGLIAVDVKNHKVHDDHGTACRTVTVKNELSRVLMFERLFRIPIWYVYSHEKDNFEEWHWISAIKIIECGTLKNGNSGEYYAFPIDECVSIKAPADLKNLFVSQLFSLSNNANQIVSQIT